MKLITLTRFAPDSLAPTPQVPELPERFIPFVPVLFALALLFGTVAIFASFAPA
jgi:hypothetical protein